MSLAIFQNTLVRERLTRTDGKKFYDNMKLNPLSRSRPQARTGNVSANTSGCTQSTQLPSYTHTYIHACIHIYARTYIHIYIHSKCKDTLNTYILHRSVSSLSYFTLPDVGSMQGPRLPGMEYASYIVWKGICSSHTTLQRLFVSSTPHPLLTVLSLLQ